jgi:hypothetical protein
VNAFVKLITFMSLLRGYKAARTKTEEWMRIKADIYYLKGIKAIRKMFLDLYVFLFCTVFLMGAIVFLHIGIYFLFLKEYAIGAALLFWLAVLYVIIMALMIARLFSQKRWMKLFRAYDLLNKVFKKEETHG